MNISHFTVVSKPDFQDHEDREAWKLLYPTLKEKTSSLRLRFKADNLKEAQKVLLNEAQKASLPEGRSNSSMQIISPSSPNQATMPIWKVKGAQNNEKVEIYIQNSQDIDCFNVESSLLYLPFLGHKNLIDIKWGSVTYRYQLMTLDQLSETVNLPISLATATSALNNVFFKKVSSEAKGNPSIIQVDSDNNISDNPSTEIVGWLNPIILNFDVNIDEWKIIRDSKENEYPYLLKLLLKPSALLLVEPHLDQTYDLRINFLIKFNEIKRSLANDSQALSLIEYIMLGSKHSQVWKPFLILDSLGGEFSICQSIDYPKPGIEKPLIYWQYPRGIPANKEWLAEHWIKEWVGEKREQDYLYSRRGDTFIINQVGEGKETSNNSDREDYREQNYLYSRRGDTFIINKEHQPTYDLTFVLSHHPIFKHKCDYINPYDFLVELLKNNSYTDRKENQSEEISHKVTLDESKYQQFWSIEEQENNLRIEFDNAGFWEYFSQNNLVPKSKILISVPLPTETEEFSQEMRWLFLDPINIKLGAYHFIWELFKYAKTDKQQEIIKINNQFGWWNDWHSTIFQNRWDVKLRLITGFILGRTRLGKENNYLGKKSDRTSWPQSENMRFSRTQ